MTDRYQTSLKAFVEKCFEGFDEEALDPNDLLAAGERFDRIRACFLAGDPLPESEQELQASVIEHYNVAKRTSTGAMRVVDVGLSLLGEFCGYKARAKRARLLGKMQVAQRLEEQAERAYNQLPEAFRW